jgi:two-component system, cell cycle response regulator CtrA
VFICKLRKKLVRAGAGDLIDTVWGRGYLIRDPSSEPYLPASPFDQADIGDLTENAAF